MDSFSGGQGMTPAGFPHSEICGSLPICGSPQLIAAYHVLHRLLTPRHPPYALSSLTEHSDARWLALPVNPYSVVKDRSLGAGLLRRKALQSMVRGVVAR